MAVNWTPEVWQLAYREVIGDPSQPDFGQTVTYGRRFWQAFYRSFGASPIAHFIQRAGRLPGIVTNTPGLVVGCAFGYLIEALMAPIASGGLGLSNVWGCDTSQWIFDQLAVEQPNAAVRSRVKQIDVRDPNGRSFWQQFISGSGRFAWIITEELLSSYDDAELPALLDACEFMLSGNQHARIVHVVGTDPAPFNTKTPVQWKAVRPSHTWVDVRAGQVI